MKKIFTASGLCTTALLCAFAVHSRADEAPVALPLSAQPTISLLATSSQGDVAAFLKTPVSFFVKDASFLGALDAVMTASGKTCLIECRQVKPMKLTFGAKKNTAGNILDALARAGGCTLYVLPNKLLLSPTALLTDAEKARAKPFTVLVSAATLPEGKTLSKPADRPDILTLANIKISTSFEGVQIDEAGDAIMSGLMNSTREMRPMGATLEQHTPLNRSSATTYIPNSTTLSFDQIPCAEALSVIAELNGCQLYLLPDRFLICGPGEFLIPAQKNVAVPALQSGLIADPSTPNS